MKTQIYNIEAQKVGEITLPSSVFGVEVSNQLIAQAVRVYLANQRKSHAMAKTRGQVSGTTKKVWAQKGTGRARHGSMKAPIFVGGGVTHGPTGNENYSLKLNKKVKKLALNSILSKFAENKRILVIDKFNSIEPKTKLAIKLLSGLRADNEVLSKSPKIGIITTKTLSNVKRSFNNISQVNLLTLKSLNVYDLSNQNFLIFSKQAIAKITK
jgi:large subunit ribosomal protein L4